MNSFEHLELELHEAIAKDCLASVEKTEQRIKNLARSISQVKGYPWFSLLAKIDLYRDDLVARLCPKETRESKVEKTTRTTELDVSEDTDDLEEFARGLETTLYRSLDDKSSRKRRGSRNRKGYAIFDWD